MGFDEVIGQEVVKERLTRMVADNRIPHAIMLCGPQGCGKLPLALAFASMLVCKDANDEAMVRAWAHPDLIFSFPIFKRKSSDRPVSDDFIEEWRSQLNSSVYFDIEDWLAVIKAENQQIVHYVYESDCLQQKLQLKPSCGGRRAVVIWLPERMNTEAANKLLKLIEEPPMRTYLIFVSQDSENVLGTIQSRTQKIFVPPLPEADIAGALSMRLGADSDVAKVMAHVAQGNYTMAAKRLTGGNEEAAFFDLFVRLMRLSYMRRIKDMREWSESVSEMGRERQKRFLAYCQRLLRENFVYNFKSAEMNFMTTAESEFSVNFARFVNERNVIPIMEELSLCQSDIEHNVNPRMVFFDFALKMIVLLIQ